VALRPRLWPGVLCRWMAEEPCERGVRYGHSQAGGPSHNAYGGGQSMPAPAISCALRSIYEAGSPSRPALPSGACPRSVRGPGCGARAAGQSRRPPPYQPEQHERLLRHQCPQQRASEIHTDQASVAEWAPKLVADSKAATRAMSMHSCLRRPDRGRRRFVGGA